MKFRKWIVTMMLAALSCVPSIFNSAWACPDTGGSLTRMLYAIEDYRKNRQAPAGADCAYSWASGINLGTAEWNDTLLNFFRSATDVQRAAAEMRVGENDKAIREDYLKKEIILRKQFIDEALSKNSDSNESTRLRPYIAKHLSNLVDAWALRSEYKEVANDLGSRDPNYVNEGAIKVWLQALWSCAKWDGNTQPLCKVADRQTCKKKISVFLEFLDEMEKRKLKRNLPTETLHDIRALRELRKKGKCLQ